MSVLKMVLGFLVGVIACAILLALISIRSPILASSDTLATEKFSEAVVEPKKNSEQTINKEGDNAVVAEPVETAPVIDPQAEGENSVFEALPDQPEGATIVPETTLPETDPEPQSDVVGAVPTPKNSAPKVIIPKPASVAPGPTAEPLGSSGSRLVLGGSSSRLPSISSDGSGSRLTLDSERGVASSVARTNDTDQPVSAFAQNANAPVDLDQPLMSFILVDIGTLGVTQSELLKQTLPIAYAVDGSRNDAGRVSGDYRDAGFEVVAMLAQGDVDSLIAGADADGWVDRSQAKNVVNAYLDAVPDALALIEAPEAKLQKNRRFFGPLFEVLSVGGHGVLSYSGGLSSANTAAKASGLKAGVISKYIGETEKNIDTIVRILDRGALDAAQDGGTVIMAVATPESVAAISKWVESTAATKVTIAPLSSTMVKLSR